MRWTPTLFAGLLAVSMFGIPQIAAARERCNNQNSNNSRSYRNSSNTYYEQGYRRTDRSRDQGYGYGDNGYRNQDYRDTGYRNQAYRDNSYRNQAYRDNGYYNDGYGYSGYQPQRTAGKSAAIIGGGAATGAAIGAMTGGLKGAAIGAAVGGVGGLIYDRTTRNRTNGW
ncbi:MAG TPA: hypothetical protein VMZ52_11485 [Bryobacteraceae bacterium]|nr:hypothetical protein [Bryobacteraceae bacterium]